MKLKFNIEYYINRDENVRVLGNIPELGNGIPAKAAQLFSANNMQWFEEIEVEAPASGVIEYHYIITTYRGELIRSEWNILPRKLYVTNDFEKTYSIKDSWKDLPEQQYAFSSAFTEALLGCRERTAAPKVQQKGVLFKLVASFVDKDHCIAITGNQDILGNWDMEKAQLMSDINYPEWQIELDATLLKFPLEYKFILYNKKEKHAVMWEENPNRHLHTPQLEENETLVLGDRTALFNLPAWKCAGVAIPVFSLRSENSFGVGDFGDLKGMIDWAVATRQKVVQILPINDTTMTHTWTDSYPYESISIYALHPMYTDLRQLGALEDKKAMADFDKRQKKLNTLPCIDYEAVNQTKWEYFDLIFKQEGEKVLASDAFADFFKANKEWLQPYAVFSHLRDTYKTPNFRQWPKYSNYSAQVIEELCQPQSEIYSKIAIYFYIQFNLHLQLLAANAHARANNVVLKGDIPIGISRNSVDAWTEPHYFNLDGQAGAPPDDFSVNGQNWGFPTYNWDVMEKDGYSWWMKRFRKMAEYFDAYRIDHILGFFRIWEIPMHSIHGLLGQFVPALPMSRQEIESYGLNFNEEFFLKPYIHEYFLEQIFGQHVEMVKQTFIETTDTWEVYRMRPEFDTQRKVEAYFAGKTDPDSIWIRDGLYALISDVLFVPDRNNPNLYHPRIAVQHDYIYRALSDEDKATFNRLYNQYYYHRHNDFWGEQAMKKLPQLTQSTRMLVCGEDLGMIPGCVNKVMNDLRIFSLEIQRMPKNPKLEFGVPEHYPYRSVCTISTHDMSTLRGWWEEDEHRTRRFYQNLQKRYVETPKVATPQICEEVVVKHMYSQSMFCILSLQDWMSIDGQWRNPNVQEERINIPSNPHHYWRWRMHLTLEQLMKAESLNEKIKTLVEQSGRYPTTPSKS